MTSFTDLPGDILRMILSDSVISVKQIIRLCGQNRRIYDALYENEAFWRNLATKQLTKNPEAVPIPRLRKDLLELENKWIRPAIYYHFARMGYEIPVKKKVRKDLGRDIGITDIMLRGAVEGKQEDLAIWLIDPASSVGRMIALKHTREKYMCQQLFRSLLKHDKRAICKYITDESDTVLFMHLIEELSTKQVVKIVNYSLFKGQWEFAKSIMLDLARDNSEAAKMFIELLNVTRAEYLSPVVTNQQFDELIDQLQKIV